MGSRFLIQLPIGELTSAAIADHNGVDTTQ